MRAKFENNVLTVITDITKEMVETQAVLKAKDEKGNDLYVVTVSDNGSASLNTFCFKGNTYVDGKLAATIVMPILLTEDEVKNLYADELLAAQKYTAQIVEEVVKKQAFVNAMFI